MPGLVIRATLGRRYPFPGGRPPDPPAGGENPTLAGAGLMPALQMVIFLCSPALVSCITGPTIAWPPGYTCTCSTPTAARRHAVTGRVALPRRQEMVY